MALKVTINQAKQHIENIMQAGLVSMLHGSPGVGKSAIIHSLAGEYGLKVIDLRLAQCDPTDLLGFPSTDREKGKATYLPMATFPVEGDPVPAGYNGWLLFLDELPLADKGVQKAAYKLLLDRMVGEFHLHENVAMVCAGNLETDGAFVEEMSTALQSRLVHLEVELNPEEWVDWAVSNDIDHRITSYIQFKPQALYTFRADNPDRTYACPRTWDFANSLLDFVDTSDFSALPVLGGTLSEGVAREFLGFTRIFKDLPKIEDIINYPTSISVPHEPSILYALTGSIAAHASPGNIDDLMAFVNRLPKEFQVVCLREIVRRDRSLLSSKGVTTWIQVNGKELF